MKPRHLDRQKLQSVITAVAKGNLPEVAARASGIGLPGFQWLMSTGRLPECPLGVEEGDWKLAAWFVDEVDTAEAQVEVKAVSRLSEMEGTDATKEFLQRRFPDRWGKQDTRNVNVKGRIDHRDVSAMSEDQIVARLTQLGARMDTRPEEAYLLPAPAVEDADIEEEDDAS